MKGNIFSTRWGIVLVGASIGVMAPLLQKLGNPANMGICVACMERDIAGAVGFHRAAVVQYLRPEILGFVLGAFLSALAFREFRPRGGSAPVARFLLGVCAMIGALVFLGCPWRALLRLAGGDGNAILGLAGLATGIWIGTLFFKGGYSLGRSNAQSVSVGLLLPILMVGLLALRIMYPPVEGQPSSGVLFYSLQGPGAAKAPLLISLGAGLLIGILAQRSRFCTMGGIRGPYPVSPVASFLRHDCLGDSGLGGEPDPGPVRPRLREAACSTLPAPLELCRNAGCGPGLCLGRRVPRKAAFHGRRRRQ